LVVGIALMGKPEDDPIPGDRIGPGFRGDLTQAEMDELMAEPRGPNAVRLLGDATTRVVYDVTANAADPSGRTPAASVSISRETHASESSPQGGVRVQVQVSYSDGFGREIQKKIQ